MENLYKMLGVARQATDKEIKIAYRDLARKHHPDLNQEEGATEKFKAYLEAYDILSDAELRKAYDEQLAANDAAEFKFDVTMADIMEAILKKRNQGHSPTKGKSIAIDLSVTISSILRGHVIETPVSFSHICVKCIGKGTTPSLKTCKTCEGKGGMIQNVKTPFGTLRQRVTCHGCNGTGKENEIICSDCGGAKSITVNKMVKVKLENTHHFGQKIVLANQAAPGLFGGSAGDIHVTLHQAADDEMKVVYEKDVENFVYVSIEDVLLNNTVTIEMPNGTSRNAILSEHAQNPRNLITFPNEGMYLNGNRGVYSVRIVVDFSVIDNKVKSSIVEGIRKVMP